MCKIYISSAQFSNTSEELNVPTLLESLWSFEGRLELRSLFIQVWNRKWQKDAHRDFLSLALWPLTTRWRCRPKIVSFFLSAWRAPLPLKRCCSEIQGHVSSEGPVHTKRCVRNHSTMEMETPPLGRVAPGLQSCWLEDENGAGVDGT